MERVRSWVRFPIKGERKPVILAVEAILREITLRESGWQWTAYQLQWLDEEGFQLERRLEGSEDIDLFKARRAIASEAIAAAAAARVKVKMKMRAIKRTLIRLRKREAAAASSIVSYRNGASRF